MLTSILRTCRKTDMSEFNITSRYALALMEQAGEKGNEKKVSDDVGLIFNTLKASKDLRNILSNPVIKESKKKDILKAVFSGKIGADAANFLNFVVDKGREEFLTAILDRFLAVRREKLGIVKIDVSSSVELSANQKTTLSERFTSYTGKNVIMNYRIDESMIGGFIAKIDDTVIDASVQNQLKLLKKSLLGT